MIKIKFLKDLIKDGKCICSKEVKDKSISSHIKSKMHLNYICENNIEIS